MSKISETEQIKILLELTKEMAQLGLSRSSEIRHLRNANKDMYDALKAISQEQWLMDKMDARCECLIIEAVAKVEKEPK